MYCKYYTVSSRIAREVYLNTRTIEEERADHLNNTLFSGKTPDLSDKIVEKNSRQQHESEQQRCIRFAGVEKF